MNQLIENLNGWGENFLGFAWPMLWQSSLLIVVVFALDFVSARKIRASIRYALWLVVLVKLLLPPTFALPSGPAYWITQTQPEIKTPVPKKYAVTFDNAMPQMEIPTAPAVVPEAPKPKLNGAGYLLLASTALSIALLALLIYRWRQVVQKIRMATDAENLSAGLESAKKLAGLSAHVRLKIVDAEMSPAVCGLFRPVVLLPRALAEKLSAEQLRAVLLHEIFHLRRRDVWLNCAQALLQIFYWWHPLLWVANARIRRVREEAVDDAVMLALRDEAETYAPTLLEVAKLALRRPLMSLGLVGIMESRSALRQRVERLVDFRAPRKAGLTFLSVLGIFAFSAVALPMGEAPVVLTEPTNTTMTSGRGENKIVLPAIATTTAVSHITNAPQVLIQAEIYQMRQVDFEKIVSDSGFVGSKPDKVENFRQFGRLAKSFGYSPASAPRILTLSGISAQIYVGSRTNGTEFDCDPVVTNGLISLGGRIKVTSSDENSAYIHFLDPVTLENGGGHVFTVKAGNNAGGTNLVVMAVSAEIVTNTHFVTRLQQIIGPAHGTNSGATSAGHKAMLSKLQTIRLDSFSSSGQPLGVVLQKLAVESKAHDQEHTGINFMFTDVDPVTGLSTAAAIDPATGLPTTADIDPATGLPSGKDTRANPDAGTTGTLVTVAMMQNATLGDVLDAVAKGAAQPIHYVVNDYGIQFRPGTNPPELFTRTFRVDTRTFISNLKKAGFVPDAKTNSSAMYSSDVRKYFASLGVDMKSPAGKAIFFNDGTGILLVRATKEDLDTVDQAIAALNAAPLQVHIKARFIEITRNKSTATNSFEWYLGSFNLNGTNGTVAVFPGSTNTASGQPENPAGVTGILTDKNFRVTLHALESRAGAEMLGEPEVTTTSGRQTQMRVTQTVTVVTNFAYQDSTSNRWGAVVPQMAQIETGPILDVVPYVLSDGYTINLALIPSVREFLGYDTPPDVPHVVGTNERVQLPVVLPRFSTRQMVATVNLWDNQTVVLGGMTETRSVKIKDKIPVLGDIPAINKFFRSEKTETQEADLLVFITATIVDPAGNRVHTDDELPFAQKGAPPQPSAPKNTTSPLQSKSLFPGQAPQ
jgi:type II secretory pathway component GspD/PulD (secretin)/beta-lactamase regulating signal transducer with metallopeptidase domain